MSVSRFYRMMAAEGKEEGLKAALVDLAGKVKPVDGCNGVDLYQDPKKTTRFIFIEHWESVDAHRACGALLGKEALAPVLAEVSEPPEGFYIEPVALS